jgi:hypothetical protein
VTDEPAEELTPAQRRVRALLAPLREQRAPHGEELVTTVGRTARWQRPVRRALLSLGHAAASIGAGIGAFARAGRRR